MSGIKAVILMSNNSTSKAKSTPAIGALNAAPMPPATPQASRSVRSLIDKRYFLEKLEPMAAPVTTIGASSPVEPPSPTVTELVRTWSYMRCWGIEPFLLAIAACTCGSPLVSLFFKR